ncbi:MAG: hypothetical protein EPO42_02050 [Gallionellaceae bacterium]|nr:MAG: hypothetical protein EPO42_02050 [Gallionellaceae bacterium]
MNSQVQTEVVKDQRKVAAKPKSKDHMWGIFILVVAIVTIIGYFIVSPQKLYKPGDDIGYNLGLAGGLMMLALLLYPLRKRVKFLDKFGLLPTWFKWHMVLGILGPLTIIFHSTYHVYIPYFHPIGSVNAAVAMYCMFLVSGSGTFGRFFYTKIHHGLYGRQATVNELKAELEQSGDVKSTFSFAPEIEKKMDWFRVQAEENAQAGKLGLAKFIAIGIQTEMLSRSLVKELHGIMRAQAREKNFTPAQMKSMEGMFIEYRGLIKSYLSAVRDASQFHTYERLFSYWHIFHIPLVYMMVFSAFYHVYAVHAY